MIVLSLPHSVGVCSRVKKDSSSFPGPWTLWETWYSEPLGTGGVAGVVVELLEERDRA